MIKFAVDKGDLGDALENALEDIKSNVDADISKALLKLYITEDVDDDGYTYEYGTVLVSTIFFTDRCDDIDEEYKKYDIYVYNTDIDGQESRDYYWTGTFESTVFLSKETIEGILEFLYEFPPTVKKVEILHSKYIDKTYIRCDGEMIML